MREVCSVVTLIKRMSGADAIRLCEHLCTMTFLESHIWDRMKLTVIIDGQDFCFPAALFAAVGNDCATHQQAQTCGALS
jgi:hypothetical protein